MFINLFCFIAENVHQGFCLLREFSKTCCFTKKKKCCFITSRDVKLISLDVSVPVATANVHRYKAVETRASHRDFLSWAGELAV